MKNYKIPVLALALLALVSCAEKARVKGTLEGAAGKQVVVTRLGAGIVEPVDTVKTKADATQYMAAGAAGLAGGLILRASTDQFINTTVTRVPIHVDNDSGRGGGGWSGGTTIDSGGFSGHSGKF